MGDPPVVSNRPARAGVGGNAMEGFLMRYRIGSWIFVLLLAGGMAGTVRGDVLPDFLWRNTFDPVHGAFNRNESAPVRLGLRMEGRVEAIPISWKVLRQEEAIAEGDTVAIPALKTPEVAVTLRLPPLEPGPYLLETTVDPHNTIEERDERNNSVRFAFAIPDGSPVRFRCEGPEGSIWELYRVELSTATGAPYPDEFGTALDTARSDKYALVVNGVETGDYVGVLFGPTVNRTPILTSYGSFAMPDPSREIEVVWQRTTPYLIGRPRIQGEAAVAVGGETGSPRWRPHSRYTLE
ncbi:MAG: hypothetical protein GF328_08220, partial [Candidatus Latescibacteria bacterium]|nr:hypothetical protein [Candidatus Latescibacterota bacterium]